MSIRPLAHTALVFPLALVLSCPWGLAAAPEPGETWEQSVQMSMAGMNMPEQKSEFCRPRNAGVSEPPMPEEGDCEMRDLAIDGQRVSWKVECKAPTSMTGSGEIVYSGESYSGNMVMSSAQGEMRMKLAGRRLGKPCDAAALEKQIAAVEAQQSEVERQMQEAQVAQCASLAEALGVFAFSGPNAICKDPAHKGILCKKLRTEEGFAQLYTPDGTALKQATELCGADPEALRSELCKGALAAGSPDFLVRSCPAEAQTVAQRECAGRKYTSEVGEKYRAFCTSYAAAMMAEGAGEQPKPEEGAVKKAKKKLSGLLGR